jgi:hypothetical protein
MENEKILPLPISGDEAKEGILNKISESLSRSCHMKGDNAYTKISGEIVIRLKLDDYGRETLDNHIVKIDIDSGLEPEGEGRSVETHIAIEPKPPNVFRVENGLSVPVATKVGKKVEVRNVKYSPRKIE